MAKIKIATWYGPTNYGTALQALSLKHYLESSGHQVDFIEDNRYRDTKSKIMRNKILKLFNLQFYKTIKYRKELKEKYELQHRYLDKWIKKVQINEQKDISVIDYNTDIYIAGGDQIWNPYEIQRTNFLLDFADRIPKISFGSSVGVQKIPFENVKFYKSALSRFSSISVREKSSQNALRDIVNASIDIVGDPTSLFIGAEWEYLMHDADSAIKYMGDYILCYFVGSRKEYWNYVRKIGEQTGLTAYVIPVNYLSLCSPFRKCIKVSPAEFLTLIKNARIVCTDSFHATIFSLHFNREFYVLKRFMDDDYKSQNSRIADLLNKMNLEDRFIANEESFERIETWDYEYKDKILQSERDYARTWLCQTIRRVL